VANSYVIQGISRGAMDALTRDFNCAIIAIAKTLGFVIAQMEENITTFATFLHLAIYITVINARLLDFTFSIRKNELVFTP
jgi:hypothetical protein